MFFIMPFYVLYKISDHALPFCILIAIKIYMVIHILGVISPEICFLPFSEALMEMIGNCNVNMVKIVSANNNFVNNSV